MWRRDNVFNEMSGGLWLGSARLSPDIKMFAAIPFRIAMVQGGRRMLVMARTRRIRRMMNVTDVYMFNRASWPFYGRKRQIACLRPQQRRVVVFSKIGAMSAPCWYFAARGSRGCAGGAEHRR